MGYLKRQVRTNWAYYTGTFYVRGKRTAGGVELRQGLIEETPPVWKRFRLQRFDSLIKHLCKHEGEAMWTKL